MARLTPTEAAKAAGVSRSTIYRMIADGRLTRNPDETIDTSELLRAGLTLSFHGTSDASSHDDLLIHDATPNDTWKNGSIIETMQRLIATLERELYTAKQRE